MIIAVIIFSIFIIVLMAFIFMVALNNKNDFIFLIGGVIITLGIMVSIITIKDIIGIPEKDDIKYSYTITVHDGKEIKKYENIDQYCIKKSGIIEFKIDDNTEVLVVNGYCEIEKVEER